MRVTPGSSHDRPLLTIISALSSAAKITCLEKVRGIRVITAGLHHAGCLQRMRCCFTSLRRQKDSDSAVGPDTGPVSHP